MKANQERIRLDREQPSHKKKSESLPGWRGEIDTNRQERFGPLQADFPYCINAASAKLNLSIYSSMLRNSLISLAACVSFCWRAC
jgi:hypothetical protein